MREFGDFFKDKSALFLDAGEEIVIQAVDNDIGAGTDDGVGAKGAAVCSGVHGIHGFFTKQDSADGQPAAQAFGG